MHIEAGPPARRHLAGGAIASLAGQAALIGANGLVSIAVARILGPSGTGSYGIAVTVFSILAPATTLGLKAGVTYLVSRGEWPERRAFWESHAAALALSLVAAGVAFALYVAWQDGPLDGLTTGMLAFTVVAAGFSVAWTFSSGILLATERYEAFAVSQFGQAGAAVTLGISLPFVLGATGAVLAFMIAQLVAALLAARAVLALPRRAGLTSASAFRLGELRRGIAFGWKTWLGELFWGLNFRVDLVILNAYVTSATVGVYFIASSLSALAWTLPGALQMVVLPRAAALAAAVERGELQPSESDATVARSLRHSVLLCAPTGVALGILLVVGVPLLYGGAFTEAVLYGFLLMPGVLAGGIGKVAASVLTGRGRPGYTLLPLLIVTPITLLLYLLVIPRFGAEGAAIVSSGSYAVSTAIAIFLVRRLVGIPLRAMLLPQRSDAHDYWTMARNVGLYVRDIASRGERH